MNYNIIYLSMTLVFGVPGIKGGWVVGSGGEELGQLQSDEKMLACD